MLPQHGLHGDVVISRSILRDLRVEAFVELARAAGGEAVGCGSVEEDWREEYEYGEGRVADASGRSGRPGGASAQS